MSDKCLLILVHKFYKDRWVTSHVFEHKGADELAAMVAKHDILLSGLKEFVYKSGGERSIVALKHEVARRLRRDAGPIGGAIRGEWSRRESGQRSGRAGILGDRVDDEEARARSPGVP